MNAPIGNLALWGGAIASALGVVAASCAAARVSGRWLGLSRWCVIVGAICTTAGAGALVGAFLGDDMRLEYVAGHSERSMGVGLKFAAWWAGQEGSLLLWAWLVGIIGASVAYTRRGADVRGEAVSVGVVSAIALFSMVVLLTAANPFAMSGAGIADGQGLNPLLRHWAMIAHPPVLFLGYAASIAPLALIIGALASGRADRARIAELRPWVLLSWIPLGAGIALGAWWAYVQLGWGGYWAWDPVENASLLPWLTGGALFHTLVVHRRSGSLMGWVLALGAATCVLCLLGMALTRSGVIQSVHAFGRTTVGPLFLGAVLAIAGIAISIAWWRRSMLRGQPGEAAIPTRDGIVVVANLLLVTMAGITLLGTLLPVAGGVFGGRAIAVGAGFYNRLVAPLGLTSVALMVIGPMLPHGMVKARDVSRRVRVPALVAIAGAGIAAICGVREPAAFASVVVCAGGGAAIAFGIGAAAVRAWREAGRRSAAALGMVCSQDSRRFGAQLAHVGVLLIVVGVSGSSLFASMENVTLDVGSSARVGSSQIVLEALGEAREEGCSVVNATVQLTDGDGRRTTISARRRFYDKSQEVGAEVGLGTRWSHDVYIALVGWEAGGTRAALQVRVIPLAIWIWIGAGVMTCGGMLSLLPRIMSRTWSAELPVAHGSISDETIVPQPRAVPACQGAGS